MNENDQKDKKIPKNAYERYFPTPRGILRAIENDDISEIRRLLTPRQVKFCEEYALDFNATAAARRAGYSPNGIQRQGSQLINHKGCRYLIEHITRSQAAKIQSIDPDYVVTKVLSIVNKDTAKDTDKLRGLELLARYLGMFIDRTEISGPDGKALEIEQRVKEEASSVINALRSMTRRHNQVQQVELHDPNPEEESDANG